MYDNVFFVDFEFLEKKFGISFSNLESYYANNKNTIILKIAQISTGNNYFNLITPLTSFFKKVYASEIVLVSRYYLEKSHLKFFFC